MITMTIMLKNMVLIALIVQLTEKKAWPLVFRMAKRMCPEFIFGVVGNAIEMNAKQQARFKPVYERKLNPIRPKAVGRNGKHVPVFNYDEWELEDPTPCRNHRATRGNGNNKSQQLTLFD